MPDIWDRLDAAIDCPDRIEALIVLRLARRFLEDGDARTALALFRQTHAATDERWRWVAEFGEAIALAAAGQFEEAAIRLPEVRRDLQARGEDVLYGKAGWWLGGALIEVGRLEESILVLSETLRTQIACDDERGAAWTGCRIGECLLRHGAPAEAVPVIEAAVASFRAMGDDTGVSFAEELRARATADDGSRRAKTRHPKAGHAKG